MKKFAAILFVLVAWITHPVESFADGWPRLIDKSNLVPCAEALQIGKATFHSNSFYLFAPPTIPEGIGSTLVLGPEAVDISGGDALKGDDAVFDKFPSGRRSGDPRKLYWEKKANYGVRLAVQEEAFNWQGDGYALFAIQETVKPDEFLARIRGGGRDSQFKSIVEGWRPPLIFQEKQSGQTWAIDVGAPSQFLSNWAIYIAGPDGVKQRCIVQFRPSVKNSASLLPQPVRKLANLLDQTMGPGVNEGTLQSTAGLRLAVQHTWASAALRPWALPNPYNSRTEVDTGLQVWSEGGPKYLEVYKDIQKQYPIAQQSLAEFYVKQFHHSAKEAKLLAEHVLDVTLRTHYTFHRDHE